MGVAVVVRAAVASLKVAITSEMPHFLLGRPLRHVKMADNFWLSRAMPRTTTAHSLAQPLTKFGVLALSHLLGPTWPVGVWA